MLEAVAVPEDWVALVAVFVVALVVAACVPLPAVVVAVELA